MVRGAEQQQADRGRTWELLVRAGVAANAESKNWTLGDLALEVAALGAHGGRSCGVEELLWRYASEVGVAYDSLYTYRWVSAKWPSESRRLDTVGQKPGASWSVHQSLASIPDREEVIRSRTRWTANEAKEFVRAWRAIQTAKAPKEDSRKADSPGDAPVSTSCKPCFRDVVLADLLPADGVCPLTGTSVSQWAPFTRELVGTC